MISTEPRIYSVDEYLELEKQSEVKHEYVDGILLEMPGESKRANRIAGNLYVVLRTELKDKAFETYSHDVKLRTEPGRKYRYPDLMVVSANDQDDLYVVHRAVLTIEVTSPSSVETDSHTKLLEYSAMPSMQCYLIVAQREPLIEVYQRSQGSGPTWEYTWYNQLSDTFKINSLGIMLTLSEVYEDVTF